MHRGRCVLSRAAPMMGVLLPACVTADIDETDHDAFFADVRVKKHLDDTDDGHGPYAMAGWSAVDGETDVLDYTIQQVTLGGGMETVAWEKVGFGLEGGFLWQINDLDTTVGTLEEENGLGVFVALDAGWHVTSWLEPCARLVATQTVDEPTTSESYEIGARLHFIDHAALFVGWRQTDYEIDDLDFLFTTSSVELEASGMVVGLVVSF